VEKHVEPAFPEPSPQVDITFQTRVLVENNQLNSGQSFQKAGLGLADNPGNGYPGSCSLRLCTTGRTCVTSPIAERRRMQTDLMEVTGASLDMRKLNQLKLESFGNRLIESGVIIASLPENKADILT